MLRSPRPLLVTSVLALALMLGQATGAPPPGELEWVGEPIPEGGGPHDPWIDASGDVMRGPLTMRGAGIAFRGGLLSGSNGLRFAATRVCLEDGTGCPSGITGAEGPMGPAGPQGETGAAGPAGPAGEIGPMGAQGPGGAHGATGPRGDTGTIGPQGATGAPGPQESTGAMGATGPRGDTGMLGPQGAPGPAGSKGEAGAQGPAGTQGPAGAPGPAGPRGEAGAQGLPGAAGPAGAAGAVGPDGAPGPQGERGAPGRVFAGASTAFTGWSGSTTTWTTIPGRTMSFEKSSSTSTLDIRYSETLGANKSGSSKADNACEFRVVLDGLTVVRSWWQADSYTGNQWTRSSTDRAALAIGAAAGAHTIAVQARSLDATTTCDAGTGDSGGFLAVYEDE